jgi:hypothetical protein
MPSNASTNSGVPPAGDGGELRSLLDRFGIEVETLQVRKSRRCFFLRKQGILAWLG